MDPISELSELFRNFPGIGSRQARRFVYFLLAKDANFTKRLTDTISKLKDATKQCEKCMLFFASSGSAKLCSICADISRDHGSLMVIEKDIDLSAIENSDVYNGYYFILGGSLPFGAKDPEEYIRIDALRDTVQKRKAEGLKEVVLALSASPDGDFTSDYIAKELRGIPDIQISILGRGLSTGTELEYSDPETIKNALMGRKTRQ